MRNDGFSATTPWPAFWGRPRRMLPATLVHDREALDRIHALRTAHRVEARPGSPARPSARRGGGLRRGLRGAPRRGCRGVPGDRSGGVPERPPLQPRWLSLLLRPLGVLPEGRGAVSRRGALRRGEAAPLLLLVELGLLAKALPRARRRRRGRGSRGAPRDQAALRGGRRAPARAPHRARRQRARLRRPAIVPGRLRPRLPASPRGRRRGARRSRRAAARVRLLRRWDERAPDLP